MDVLLIVFGVASAGAFVAAMCGIVALCASEPIDLGADDDEVFEVWEEVK